MPKRFRISLICTLSALVVLAMLAGLEILKVRGLFMPSAAATEVGGEAIETGQKGHQITGRMYDTNPALEDAPLVIVLHGDAPGRKPSYQYVFASNLAKTVRGARVIALLRPGYEDPFGARSDGDRGNFAAGENYTASVVADLATAIGGLKARFGSRNVIVVGHSGGAALAADVAALNPGLVQTAVLVSCPCDVPSFRRHMAKAQLSPVWLLPVKALSPIEALSEMNPDTSIVAISGSQDPIALPQYTREYIDKARSLNLDASLVSIPGQGHEILLIPEVEAAVVQVLQRSN